MSSSHRYKKPNEENEFRRVYTNGCKMSLEHRRKVSQAHLRNNLKNKGICRVCKRSIKPEEAVKWALKNNKWACLDCERKRSREKQLRYKQELFKEYGNKCVCCGETILEFLTIDHINNDGHVQRQLYKQQFGKTMNYYNWLRQNNYPKENYQVLCFNCNCGKAIFGICPHEKYRNDISILRTQQLVS